MPNDLTETITNLDDETAVRILQRFAQPRVHFDSVATELTPEMEDALAAEFGVSGETSATEGDLARSTLLLAVEEEANRKPLEALISGPEPQRMEGFAASIAVITAALVVLQTHVKFEKDKQGHIYIKVEKKPLSDNLLAKVITRLFGLAGK